MVRLYLVRHGENWANVTKEFSCRHVDYSLTPKGVLQAQQTAEFLMDKNIHEIYSSPLKRARETAEIIAARANLQVVVMENFREIDMGSLEQQPPTLETWALFFQIAGDWLDGRPDSAFPGGEDYHALWGRMRAGIEQIVGRKTRRNIVVVGHGGLFTLTMKDLCRNVDSAWLRSSTNHNCSITEVSVGLRGGRLRGRLLSWAAHTHLHGRAAEVIDGAPTAALLELRRPRAA